MTGPKKTDLNYVAICIKYISIGTYIFIVVSISYIICICICTMQILYALLNSLWNVSAAYNDESFVTIANDTKQKR